ncbi:HPr family phosphocarrier protein [Halalkalibacter krulwichiae]|uniref:PTS HPr component phosphorylation site n=1 Tax=Halalkalibacter krulwichiae TaxID=199441 RepID=A0A1X9M835_9BACI|nr:HPr family phosphocarrier protein [Halalkalibacter krulwichiae]ARK29599.1 PTS HPr component phosphorylation site [Halalkalibacter krulwichiae]
MKVKVIKPLLADSACLLINKAREFPEEISIKKRQLSVDAKNLLDLLSISLEIGDIIEIQIIGSRKDEITNALLATGVFERLN